MEETIGYEALFSTGEWATLDFAEWEGPDPEGPHKVTVWYPPGEHQGNDDRHELECDVCGYVGATDTLEEAETAARLHEVLDARFVTDSPTDQVLLPIYRTRELGSGAGTAEDVPHD